MDMTKKEFTNRKKYIRETYANGEKNQALQFAEALIAELHEGKKYSWVIELYRSKFWDYKSELWSFEIAFALSNDGSEDEAESVYEYVLELQPFNSSVLNNLSNIKKNKNKIAEAFALIERAFEANPDDTIVAGNHESISHLVREKEEKERFNKLAIELLPKENEFVINKLTEFYKNASKDPDLKNNRLPIPRWKLKMMMATDQQKANSLIEQWIDKGYLHRPGERGQYQEYIYELNPFVHKELPKIKSRKLNESWLDGINNLEVARLDELGYFELKQKVSRVKKSIRALLDRDLDELYINYLFKNYKAVVILSGSIVETLLIYHFEKKKLSKISYSRKNQTISKKLYDADLGDLLLFYEHEERSGSVEAHLGNVSRIYRNFVHPGKELREQMVLDEAKSILCLAGVQEVLRKICT